jgi:hypothetical protein
MWIAAFKRVRETDRQRGHMLLVLARLYTTTMDQSYKEQAKGTARGDTYKDRPETEGS